MANDRCFVMYGDCYTLNIFLYHKTFSMRILFYNNDVFILLL